VRHFGARRLVGLNQNKEARRLAKGVIAHVMVMRVSYFVTVAALETVAKDT